MVTIYFDPIDARKKEHNESLETARSQHPDGTVRAGRIPLLRATLAKKMISLAMGLLAQERHEPKIELGS